jgi:DNA repair exonuclease SbcCD nuclease subunit
MKFIVYADIHHDEKAAKCITLDDTLAIESQLFARAKEGFDFIIFAGDRFLKREPLDIVKTKADLNTLAGLDPKIRYFHLIGNHDRVDNTLKWHTSESLKSHLSWFNVQPGVMDKPGTYKCDLPVLIHALPAGYKFDASMYEFDSSMLNILVFHDIVKGAYVDNAGAHSLTEGLSLADLDLPQFDYIFGGDIHVPQKLNFQNSKGGYVGSVLQRTRADAQCPRGWIEAEAVFDNTKWSVTTKFVPTRNFFSRYTFEVTNESTYENLVNQIEDNWVTDQAVELTLRGTKENVDRVASNSKWQNFTTFLCARDFNIIREYQSQTSMNVIDMSNTKSPLDDLDLYINSGFADLGTLPRSKVFDILGGCLGTR